MKSKKKIVIAFIAVIALAMLASGCDSSSKKSYAITSKEFKKGTDGLSIEFLKGTPPTEAFEDSLFQLGIKVHNKGAYNPENAYLSIGIENDYMCLGDCTEKEKDSLFEIPGDEIKGKSLFNPVGGMFIKKYNIKTKKIDSMSNQHRSLIYASLCYSYSTELVTDVCIDPDPVNINKKEKSCNVESKAFSGQGAPVAITKVDVKMIPVSENAVRPEFLIYVKNMGNGNIISEESVKKACTAESMSSYELGYVKLKSFAFSSYEYESGNNGDIVCFPEKLKIAKDKENYFRCRLRAGDKIGSGSSEDGNAIKGDAFTTQLSIALSYGYFSTISRPVLINKLKSY